MELSGKIIAALEPRGGVSQRTGNTWKSQEFVIETHEQYPKHCVFRVFGEDRLRDFDLKVNEEVTVSFDIDAHEYQGRWYNDITVWRVQRGVVDAGAPAAPLPLLPLLQQHLPPRQLPPLLRSKQKVPLMIFPFNHEER